MVKRNWLRYYDQLPERSYKAKVIQSWDTAAKAGVQNDYSVCTSWLLVDGHYYLMDLIRGRFEYPQLRGIAIAQAQRHKPHVILIEDTSTGSALAPDLRKVVSRPVQPIKVAQDKRARLSVQQEKFATGRVLFPKGASFLPELEAELLSFPQGNHDDQVDSISQALAHELKTFDYRNVWVPCDRALVISLRLTRDTVPTRFNAATEATADDAQVCGALTYKWDNDSAVFWRV